MGSIELILTSVKCETLLCCDCEGRLHLYCFLGCTALVGLASHALATQSMQC